ncbi:MAG: hypothetical protein OEM39_09440, partial [Acidimicrobiia bacterium]|nr:hypothetical protein [Acidimicrobiia bacterium]
MSRSLVPLMVVLGMFAAACGSPEVRPLGTPSAGFPQCDDVPTLAAPPDAYRAEPIYVGNEMPVDEVQEWAQSKPDYQGIWIDRDHNGWITVAFTGDVGAVQQDLLEVFPGVGVVAVEVETSEADLQSLQTRLHGELVRLDIDFGSGTYENKGVVGLDVSRMTPELEAVLEGFAGEPLCVNVPDQSLLPELGPQPSVGDGWRLLADEAMVGEPYRTGIAFDAESLAALWLTIGLNQTIPDVDFESEVVIWFGAVYGSSCPNLRLDDVVVDGATIYALIVLPDNPLACTDDANPHA